MKSYKNSPQKDTFVLDSTRKSNRWPEYNGLMDPNLSSFFASPRRRRLLILQKLISPAGQINEKMCLKKITCFKTSAAFHKSSMSPMRKPVLSKKQKSRTPEEILMKQSSTIGQKLPHIQPMSSDQFKEVLNKRRLFVTSSD